MIILMGKSGSGKDTVVGLLKQRGYRKIVAYTSRPKRDGEVDGETYHFIRGSEFGDLRENGHFIVTETYLTNGGLWEYGIDIDDVLGADDSTILILNPRTGKKLVTEHPELNIKSIYLYCPDRVLEKRLLARGDDVEEALRRLNQDDRDFRDLEKWVDVEIYNSSTNPEVAADSIVRFMEVDD